MLTVCRLGIICTLLFVVLGHVVGEDVTFTWPAILRDPQFWMMIVILFL